jgi:chromosomal replication initiation ATPase DnaA
MTPQQLPLIIPGTPDYGEASFVAAPSNEAARTWLGRTELWPDRRLALWGEADRGKTHLLRIWAARSGADMLDGPSLSDFPDVASPGGAAVDDADRADAAALLHLLNTAHDLDRPVLLAARLPPARWSVALPDLDSRIRAITAVEVGAPEDDLMGQLLLRWLGERRLTADSALHDRLLLRLPRNPHVLLEAVVLLDREAHISRRRTITAAMVRAALVAVGEGAPEENAARKKAGEGHPDESVARDSGAR